MSQEFQPPDFQTLRHSTPAGGLAQLARAPALQAGGQRFESVILHHAARGALRVPPRGHAPRARQAIFDMMRQAKMR